MIALNHLMISQKITMKNGPILILIEMTMQQFTILLDQPESQKESYRHNVESYLQCLVGPLFQLF